MKTSSRKLLSLLVPSSLVFTLVLATFSLKAEPPSPHLTEATTAMRGCDELKTLRQKLQIDFRLQAATMKQEITKLNDAPADQQVALLVQTLTHLT